MKNERIDYLTTAKGLLIILVVLGHSNVPFRNFIYLFHVAAFFFISGVFYKEKYVEKPLLFLYKKIKTLYLPFVLYSVAFVFLHNFFVTVLIYSQSYGTNNERNYIYNVNDYIIVLKNILTFGSTEQLLVSFWFITCLFTISIIIITFDFLLQKITLKKKDIILFLIVASLFSIGMFLSHFNIVLPRFINTSLVSLAIFYAGFKLKPYLPSINFNWATALCCFLILVLNTFYGNQEMVTNRYPNPAFFLLNSFLGIYLTIYISKKLSTVNFINSNFSYFGNNTFHILALHTLAFKTASLIIIYIYKLPIAWLGKFPTITEKAEWWPLYGILGVLIPVSIVYIIQNTIFFSRKVLSPNPHEKRSY